MPTLALALLLVAACGERHYPPELSPHPYRSLLDPGRIYALDYPQAIDLVPVGTTWAAPDFAGSPLAFMERPSLLLKADDFGGPINAAACDFIERADAEGALVSLGIITGRLEADSDAARSYGALDAAGFEAWFHGDRHDYKGDDAEFAAASVEAQVATFATGLEKGREALGIDFHTFGAPGNALSDATAAAFAAFPQLVIWYFGPAAAPELQPDVLVLPRVAEMEESPGHALAADAVLAGVLDALASPAASGTSSAPSFPAAVTLQVHPLDFGAADVDEAVLAVRLLRESGSVRFAGPFDHWRWQEDRSGVRIAKVGAQRYLLDLSQSQDALRLELDPAQPLPTVCITDEGWPR